MENEMDEKVLVTYASKYGATAEIAKKIGETLRQAGLQTDILPVKQHSRPDPISCHHRGQRSLHWSMAQGCGQVPQSK